MRGHFPGRWRRTSAESCHSGTLAVAPHAIGVFFKQAPDAPESVYGPRLIGCAHLPPGESRVGLSEGGCCQC